MYNLRDVWNKALLLKNLQVIMIEIFTSNFQSLLWFFIFSKKNCTIIITSFFYNADNDKDITIAGRYSRQVTSAFSWSHLGLYSMHPFNLSFAQYGNILCSIPPLEVEAWNWYRNFTPCNPPTLQNTKMPPMVWIEIFSGTHEWQDNYC